mgnify:CR=1 FL=1
MSRTFEQGWAARPFAEQFPEMDAKEAERLDRLNHAITDLYMADMPTDSQVKAIREKKMPRAVGKAVAKMKAPARQH